MVRQTTAIRGCPSPSKGDKETGRRDGVKGVERTATLAAESTRLSTRGARGPAGRGRRTSSTWCRASCHWTRSRCPPRMARAELVKLLIEGAPTMLVLAALRGDDAEGRALPGSCSMCRRQALLSLTRWHGCKTSPTPMTGTLRARDPDAAMEGISIARQLLRVYRAITVTICRIFPTLRRNGPRRMVCAAARHCSTW